MQFIFVLNTAAGICLQGSNLWYNDGFSFLPNVFYYGICLLFYLNPKNNIKIPIKQFTGIIFAGLFDSMGNMLFNVALQLTSIASVNIIASLNIPFSMIFSFLIHKQKFNWIQIVFSLLAMVMAVLFTWLDQDTESHFTPTQQLWGDTATIIASASLSLGSVLTQKFSKGLTSFQYMPRMATGAFVAMLITFLCTELENAKNAHWESMLMVFGFGVAIATLFSLVILVIQHSSASLYMVSMLPSNIYSFLASLIVFKTRFKWYIVFPAIGLLLSIVGYLYGDNKMNIKNKLKEEELLKEEEQLLLHQSEIQSDV